MAIPKFTTFTSGAVPVEAENIDTDQIIPARFLKATERKGFGDNLFRDWRYDAEGRPIAAFPPSTTRVTRGGFSSRAATSAAAARANMPPGRWPTTASACLVPSFFADIFRNNALNNGLLLLRVSDDFLAAIFDDLRRDPASRFTVDLEAQTLTALSDGRSERFEIDAYKKKCLLNGYDDVDYLLSIADRIEAFEASRR